MKPVNGRTSSEAEAAPLPESLQTVTGQVKWFDLAKGYGFLVPDDAAGDVLVHYNLLARHGYKILPEGSRVTALVRQGPRGRHAEELLTIEPTNHPCSQSPKRRSDCSDRIDPQSCLDLSGDFEPVQVRWFNRVRGYGFLLRGDGETEIFIHMETVRRAGLETLVAGQSIQARVFDGPRGALAVEIGQDPGPLAC